MRISRDKVNKLAHTVADTLDVHYVYPGPFVCTYTNTQLFGAEHEAIEFCGTDAHLRINRTGFQFYTKEKEPPAERAPVSGAGDGADSLGGAGAVAGV